MIYNCLSSGNFFVHSSLVFALAAFINYHPQNYGASNSQSYDTNNEENSWWWSSFIGDTVVRSVIYHESWHTWATTVYDLRTITFFIWHYIIFAFLAANSHSFTTNITISNTWNSVLVSTFSANNNFCIRIHLTGMTILWAWWTEFLLV